MISQVAQFAVLDWLVLETESCRQDVRRASTVATEHLAVVNASIQHLPTALLDRQARLGHHVLRSSACLFTLYHQLTRPLVIVLLVTLVLL